MRKGKAQTSHAKANTQAKNYPSIYLSIKLCIAPQKKATQIEKFMHSIYCLVPAITEGLDVMQFDAACQANSPNAPYI